MMLQQLPQCIVTETRNWLESVIIAYNICPFAKQEFERDSIAFVVCEHSTIEAALVALMEQCRRLSKQPEIETTLVIFPQPFTTSFDDFLDFSELARQLLIDQGYEGVLQIADFHPDYCFNDCSPNDPANYTNRSPYPLLHLIREQSISKALTHYPEPEKIPERNIALCQQKGLQFMQQLLASCFLKEK